MKDQFEELIMLLLEIREEAVPHIDFDVECGANLAGRIVGMIDSYMNGIRACAVRPAPAKEK